MKKNLLTLAFFLSLGGITYAADNKSNAPTISPSSAPEQKVNITDITLATLEPTAHKELLFTVTTSGSGKCNLKVLILGPMFGSATDGFISKNASGVGSLYAPAGTAKIALTAKGPGAYIATASGDKALEPKCSGQAEHRFIVSPPQTTPPPVATKPSPDTPEKPCKKLGKEGVGKDCEP